MSTGSSRGINEEVKLVEDILAQLGLDNSPEQDKKQVDRIIRNIASNYELSYPRTDALYTMLRSTEAMVSTQLLDPGQASSYVSIMLAGLANGDELVKMRLNSAMACLLAMFKKELEDHRKRIMDILARNKL